METMIRAYAKVNIGLKVLDKRSDGYHNIDSHFLLIPFYDELYLSLRPSPFLSVTISGNEGYLPPGKTDIMEKAAVKYSERTGITFSLSVRINKLIPSQAGLGGGSSDAAAVLLFLNSRFSAMEKEDLVLFSSSVGADVPFFVSGAKAARVGGIGEIVEEEEWNLPYSHISLFRGVGSGVSTAEAYGKLDERKLGKSVLPRLSYPLERPSFPNDFEILEGDGILSIIAPYLSSGDYASLSGSGSVWFALTKGEIKTTVPEFIGSRPLLMDERRDFC